MTRAMILSALFLFVACSTAPKGTSTDPKFLFEKACGRGGAAEKVTGSVWLKAKSKEASGQFPAAVSAQSPDTLRLEVTNLLGGTEAVIEVKDQKFSIQVPKQQGRNQAGRDTWGGIPLIWATDLFLGRVPCPFVREGATLAIGPAGELVAEIPAGLRGDAERFVYRFRTWAGEPWVEALHWERKGVMSATVDFKFDDPDELQNLPRKWEAASAQGEVKVRWKDRDIQPPRKPGV